MQIPKEEIRKKIIEEAKKEFLEGGFKGMSMRSVAGKVNISLSNIYNYFSSKDDIFYNIIKDAANHIEMILKSSEEKEYREFDNPEELEWHIGFINMIYRLISVYREQLKLLFVLSDGSKFEGYKEKTAERYIKSQPCSYGREGKNKISDFFLYNFTVFYLNYLENLVKEEIDELSMKRYLVEIAIYSHSGFKAIIDENKEIFNKIIERIN